MNAGRVTLALVANTLAWMYVGWPLIQSYEDILERRNTHWVAHHTMLMCLASGPDKLASVQLRTWAHPDRHALNLIPGPFPNRTAK